MIHIYRIIYVSGFWRLMRDDKLRSTHISKAAAESQMARDKQMEISEYARAYAARKGE